MSRPTPAIQSLTENPAWMPKRCRRCGIPMWVVPYQFEAVQYCGKACRCLPPHRRIMDRVTKVLRNGGMEPDEIFQYGPECWMCSLSLNIDGYSIVKVKGKLVRSHRWMLENEHGLIPEGLLALHRCIGAKNCVNPAHLYPGTVQDNTRDRMEQGRHRSAVGEACHWSILTAEQAREIKKHATLETLQGFADKFGVARYTVYQVFAGINWKHISVDDA